MIITLDGPVASGKSSTAKALAKRLGCFYLNTGLMYRAMAWLIQNNNLQVSNLTEVPFDYIIEDHAPRILFEGQDITDKLLSSLVSKNASILSQDKNLRKMLVKYQQAFSDKGCLVVEGRDAGTVIFPNADLKIFLTASNEVRANRWLADTARNNSGKNLDEAKEAINERDERDESRKICPLKIAKGAIIIDTSNLNLDDIIGKILLMLN